MLVRTMSEEQDKKGVEEAIRRIEEARSTNATSLDLVGLSLSAIPDSLAQLASLQKLNLRNNQIAAIPDSLTQLANLEVLDLSSNKIPASAIPGSLAQLANLKVLKLSGNRVNAIPDSLCQLVNLQELDLGSNQIAVIPDSLAQLANLQLIDLNFNQIVAIPNALAELANLQKLGLNYNQIAVIPDSLARLANLQSLDLGNNQIGTIPDSVLHLANLQTLDLMGNRIVDIPGSISCLVNLEDLNLSSNPISVIPSSIAQLIKLKVLRLYNNRITDIPDSIARLTNLRHLEVAKNQITVIPDWVSELVNLELLYLYNNGITALPESLGKLRNLRRVILERNKISTIPDFVAQLTKLESINLGSNQITAIPYSLTQLTELKELELDGNPLSDELFAALKRGIPSFFRYLESTKKRKVYPRTVKLVLLGEPKSGKTTLLEALKGNPAPCDDKRKETLGVNVVSIEKSHPTDHQPMYLSAWDFAGQHMEHATHQFFLTENAIYLVLWNARQGTESGKRDLWYWLELLKMRVREPKFLLVATHTEHTPPDLNLSEIERNYKGYQGNLPIELETLSGFMVLEAKVLALAADSPSLRAEWQPEWLKVRDEAREVRQKQPYMTPAAFRSLLKKNRVTKAEEQKDLIGQLHTLGEILYYQERDELASLVILNPEWVTELIALVVRSKEAREHGGMLLKTDLDKLWKKAKLAPKVRNHLISLMDWFDLTYATGQQSEPGIVVEALPYSTPDDLKGIELPAGRPQMEMIFRFPLQRHLPPGIPTWGIARAHRLAKRTPWRDAAAFEDKDTNSHAVILASDSAKEVRLRVTADYPPFFFGRLDAILRDTFKRYPGAEPERRLPCSCQPECPTSYLYETVLKRWQDGKPYVTCDRSGEDVSVQSLLSGAKRTDTEEGLLALRAEMRRQFTEYLRAMNEQMENKCPSVFTLLPSHEFTQLDTWIESVAKEAELELRLYCEHDSGWHETAHSVYRFRNDQEWFLLVKKGWNRFVGVTKYVGPLIKTAGKLSKVLPIEVSGMALEKLPEAFSMGTDTFRALEQMGEKKLVDIETRYLLKELIEHLDQQRGNAKPKNGGLHPWLIDDGRLLWLCPDHLKLYKTRA